MMIGRCTAAAAISAAALGVVLSSPARADGLDTLRYAVSGGTPNLDARLRYEHVEQDNIVNDADVLNIRARLGYTTGKWNQIDGQLEFEGISEVGNNDNYNSTRNGKAAFPVVADPEVNEVNQAWIRWAGLPGTTLKYGRQRIVFDNARWIGNVGWRQNEQTYDAAMLTGTWIPKTTINYAYVTNVNAFRFFSIDMINTDDIDIEAHLVNVAIAASKMLNITAYAYLLDFESIPAPPIARQDTQTIGLRATGAIPVSSLSFSYALEYADQQDYKDAPSTVDADYTLIEAALSKGKLKATVGYEILSGDGVYSLQTPLNTAHAHQGWADQFLVTPATGLERLYASLAGAIGPVSMTAIYHDFSSDEGSINYGDEIDLQASYLIVENFTVTAKHASYSADEFPVAGTPPVPFDTEKYWLFAEYKF